MAVFDAIFVVFFSISIVLKTIEFKICVPKSFLISGYKVSFFGLFQQVISEGFFQYVTNVIQD